MAVQVSASDLATTYQGLEARYVAANPESKSRHEQAKDVFPGGNTRTGVHYAPFPLVFAEASGAVLRDVDGHSLLDFLNNFSAGIFGHNDPTIQDEVARVLRAGMSFSGINRYEAEFAGALKKRYPACDLVRFCNSGTEANLLALQLARTARKRDGIGVVRGGYHGAFINYAKGQNPINLHRDVTLLRYNDISQSVDAIRSAADKLGAVIVEPMLASGGCIPAEKSYLEALREVTAELGIILIFDEVVTSRLWAHGLQGVHGVQPDLTSYGKFIGGGFSFGAVGGRRELMNALDQYNAGSLVHSGTFNNNVATMVAGLMGLTQRYTPEVAVELSGRGEKLRADLNALFSAQDVPMVATGIGSVMNLHMQREPIRRPEDVHDSAVAKGILHLDLISRGFLVARRGYITLSLAHTEDHLARFQQAIAQFVEDYGPCLRNAELAEACPQ